KSHDVLNPFTLVLQKRLAAALQPGAENGMSKVSNSFVPGPDRILFGCRAMAQSCNLRKNVPYPMGLLLPPLQFTQGPMIILSLGNDEALQIVWIRLAH